MDKPDAIFVGRKAEKDAFIAALTQTQQGTRSLYLQADGGMGKTRLLEQFQLVCDQPQKQIPYTQIVDFYETANQQVDSVMKRLARELDDLVCRFKGKADAWFLFSVDVQHQNDLEQGVFSSRLRQEFKDHKTPLSSDEKITIDKSTMDNRWCICVASYESYIVLKEGDALNIYGAPSFFVLFWGKVNRLEDARRAHQGSETIATLGRLAEQQFYADYNELAAWFKSQGKPVVLFFDTFEVVQEYRRVSFWLLRRLLPAVINTVLVLAGRRALPEDAGVTMIKVGNFTDEEIKDYLLAWDIFLPDPAAQRERICALTNGNPLLLALVVDWATRHSDLNELLRKTGIEFERELVNDILHLSDSALEFQAVWYMAHVWHRFDASILAWIYGNDEYQRDEAERVFANVTRFPFVKKREYSSTYQLHDVMCDLVREHVLPVEDADGSLRRDLSRRMIGYYKQEMIHLRAANRKRDVDMMRAEQLYHYFYIDPARGYARFERLFHVADTRNDAPLCDALISSAQRFRNDLDARQQLWLDVYQGWRDKNLGDYGAAAAALEGVIGPLQRLDDPEVDKVANSLGYIYRLLGDYDRAQQTYEAALEANRHARKLPAQRLATAAMILNNLGNVYRLQGQVDKAHRYAMISLMHRRQLNDERGIANSCFYLGLVSREFGDITGALRYFAEAERRYESLGSREGSANVMRWHAYIYGHFNEYAKAISLAEKSSQMLGEADRLSTDLADTLDILGRLYRDKAAYDFEVARQQPASGTLLTQQALQEQRDKLLGVAEDYIERGYRMAVDVGDKFKEAESILSFVRLYYVRQEYRRSLNKYREGIKICREPRNYYLLASYFELFAGIAYFALKKYRYAFRHFARRAYYASFCRAMELGMAMDSIGSSLLRLEDPNQTAYYAGFLLDEWKRHSEWESEKRFPHILELCCDIKGNVMQ